MSGAIEVTKLSLPREPKGATKAFFDLKLGGIEVFGCRIVQQAGADRPWVALPSRPVRSKADGSGSGWVDLIKLSPSLKAEVDRVATTRYLEALAEQSPLGAKGQRAWDRARDPLPFDPAARSEARTAPTGQGRPGGRREAASPADDSGAQDQRPSEGAAG